MSVDSIAKPNATVHAVVGALPAGRPSALPSRQSATRRRPVHSVPRERLEMLRALPMFADNSDPELARFDGLLTDLELRPGAALTVQGQFGRQASVIVSGIAEVRVNGTVVGIASSGDLVGDAALADGQPSRASVVALSRVRVLVMNPAEFRAVSADPRVAAWMALRPTRG